MAIIIDVIPCYNYYYRLVYIIHYWEFLNTYETPQLPQRASSRHSKRALESDIFLQRPGPKSHHLHQGQNMVMVYGCVWK